MTDLTIEEKSVLDLFVKAEQDKDFKYDDFSLELRELDPNDEISASLAYKGYINASVKKYNTHTYSVGYEYKNGRIITEKTVQMYNITL